MKDTFIAKSLRAKISVPHRCGKIILSIRNTTNRKQIRRRRRITWFLFFKISPWGPAAPSYTCSSKAVVISRISFCYWMTSGIVSRKGLHKLKNVERRFLYHFHIFPHLLIDRTYVWSISFFDWITWRFKLIQTTARVKTFTTKFFLRAKLSDYLHFNIVGV